MTDKSGVIETVIQAPTEWNPELFLSGLTNALKAHPEANCVFAASDFAFTAIQSALEKADKWAPTGQPKHMWLATQDLLPAAVKPMEDGYIDLHQLRRLCPFQGDSSRADRHRARQGPRLWSRWLPGEGPSGDPCDHQDDGQPVVAQLQIMGDRRPSFPAAEGFHTALFRHGRVGPGHPRRVVSGHPEGFRPFDDDVDDRDTSPVRTISASLSSPSGPRPSCDFKESMV